MKKINKSKHPRDVVAYFLLLIGGFAFQSTAIFAADSPALLSELYFSKSLKTLLCSAANDSQSILR